MTRIASLALVGLLAAVGQLTVLPQAAVAADPSAAVDEIQQIRDATWAGIDAAVAEVAATLPGTATDAEARTIRDTAKGTVDDLFWSADDAMALVVEAAGNDPAVEEAYDLAWFALKDHRLAAKSQITSLYEAWKFEYNAPPA
ncbi:MAG: hypothetical protein HKO82_07965, partial [Acidimicrobiia bacterium]|nr:hypothetical protein [Acidimicrobiia bacterium]